MSTQHIDAVADLGLEVQRRRSAGRLSSRAQRNLFIAGLVAADCALLGAAFAAAYIVRFDVQLPIFQVIQTPQRFLYIALSIALVPVWVALFWLYGLYDWEKLLGGTQEYAAVFHACVAGAVLIALGQFAIKDLEIARGWVGLTCGLTFVFVFCGRFFLRRLAYAARQRGYLVSSALILGANEEGRLLGAQLLAWPTSGVDVVGYLDDDLPPGTRVCGSLYSLGRLDRLDEFVSKYQVEEFILAASAIEHDALLDIFRRYGMAPGVQLRLSSGLFELLSTGLHIKELASVPLIGVNRVRLTGTDVALKKLLDVGLALAALLALAPVMLVVAILVKLDSSGPVLYRRQVMGLNGRQFGALKFRTMHINGDAILAANPELMDELATTHKLKGDPRITRVGWVLRKYSLDELPQLFNVIRGDMSLVGPRMISPPELKQYGQWATNLLTVRPGITGLWQVSGRSDVTYEERVRLDMFYVRNYSIWLDLQLIFRTIPVVLSGKGAY
ncbi:MAG: sugar transferase [Chloroflexi bacterium]|nr:sugar transferase [Chloroflexota bacterium]